MSTAQPPASGYPGHSSNVTLWCCTAPRVHMYQSFISKITSWETIYRLYKDFSPVAWLYYWCYCCLFFHRTFTALGVGKLAALCTHQHWWFEWIMLLILNSDWKFLEKLMLRYMKFFTVPLQKKKSTTISPSTIDLLAHLEKEYVGLWKTWRWGKPFSS